MNSRRSFLPDDIEDIAGDAMIIPAIKSFELENLGVITKASLHFTQRVTFVVRELPALGETTLIRAMAAAAGAALPLTLLRSEDCESLRISAVWKCDPVEVRTPPLMSQAPPHSAMGQRTIAAVTHLLARVGSGQCVILGSDCFGCLDQRHRTNAFRLLEESSAQVVAFIHHSLQEEIPAGLRKEPAYKIVPDPSDSKRSCTTRVEL
jgi:hypothetical protein